jgi:predicted enzyme related to lactoylglutathione lyase
MKMLGQTIRKENQVDIKNNVVGWFEIPVIDMSRAIKFYESVFGFKIERNKMDSIDMGWFPWKQDGLGSPGSLVFAPEYYEPSSEGTLVYFTAPSGDPENELSRVEKAGGKVLKKKTMIFGEYGFYALITDTEGNRVAIHSRK